MALSIQTTSATSASFAPAALTTAKPPEASLLLDPAMEAALTPLVEGGGTEEPQPPLPLPKEEANGNHNLPDYVASFCRAVHKVFTQVSDNFTVFAAKIGKLAGDAGSPFSSRVASVLGAATAYRESAANTNASEMSAVMKLETALQTTVDTNETVATNFHKNPTLTAQLKADIDGLHAKIASVKQQTQTATLNANIAGLREEIASVNQQMKAAQLRADIAGLHNKIASVNQKTLTATLNNQTLTDTLKDPDFTPARKTALLQKLSEERLDVITQAQHQNTEDFKKALAELNQYNAEKTALQQEPDSKTKAMTIKMLEDWCNTIEKEMSELNEAHKTLKEERLQIIKTLDANFPKTPPVAA
jgi:hypothetical protein